MFGQEMGINRFMMKTLAIIAMTIDHIAWLWVDIATWQGQLMHFVGRLTAPLMCLFLVEGYFLTKNKINYAQRLLIFALLSQIPFTLLSVSIQDLLANPSVIFSKANILFNLLLGLMAIWVMQSRWYIVTRLCVIVFLLYLSLFMDWGIYVIVFCLVLSYFRNDQKQQIIAYLLIAMALLLLADLGFNPAMPMLTFSWFPLGILLVPIVWYFYDGKKGSNWGGRYFFYWYYPAHMLILALVADFWLGRIS